MFTTGSKLFLGLAVLAATALAVLGWATGWEMQATVGAASALSALAFLAGLVLALRDDDTPIPDADAPVEAPVVAPAPRHAGWSVAAGFGAALAAIGAALDERLFIAGLVVVGLAALEWVVQSWSDRASADPAFNDRLRGRIMHPLEFPVAGLLCGGLIVFGFSRVMVALSTNGAVVVFAVLGVVVMAVAVLLATRPSVSRAVTGGVLSVSAILALVGGIAGVSQGERDFHEHETECSQRELGSKTVTDKSGVAAELVFDGESIAPDHVTGGRSAYFTVIFKNQSDEEAKLLVEAGERDRLDEAGQPVKGADGATLKEPIEYCTDLVRPDTQAALTLRFVDPGRYEFSAQDEAGEALATGEVVIP